MATAACCDDRKNTIDTTAITAGRIDSRAYSRERRSVKNTASALPSTVYRAASARAPEAISTVAANNAPSAMRRRPVVSKNPSRATHDDPTPMIAHELGLLELIRNMPSGTEAIAQPQISGRRRATGSRQNSAVVIPTNNSTFTARIRSTDSAMPGPTKTLMNE